MKENYDEINARKLQEKINQVASELIWKHDIGFVFTNMESMVILPNPYVHTRETKEEFQNNKKLHIKSLVEAIKKYEQLNEEKDLLKTTFNYIKENINSDFCSDISKYFSESESKEYIMLKEKYKRLYIEFKNEIQKLHYHKNTENLLFVKDHISKIIDSKESAKLSYYEDSFVLKELDSLDENILKSSPSTIRENISKIKKHLISRIDEYNKFRQLSSKDTIKIVPDTRYQEDDER